MACIARTFRCTGFLKRGKIMTTYEAFYYGNYSDRWIGVGTVKASTPKEARKNILDRLKRTNNAVVNRGMTIIVVPKSAIKKGVVFIKEHQSLDGTVKNFLSVK